MVQRRIIRRAGSTAAATRKSFLVVVGLVTSLTLLVATVPAKALPADGPADFEEAVFVVTTGDETTGDAMRKLADSDSPDAARAAEILEEWDAHSNGEPPVVEEPSTAQALGDIQPFASWQWSDPNTWPVIGSKGSGQWYWKDLKFAVEGKFCVTEKCKVTDRLEVTNTVDPGVETSRITTKTLYSPNAGNFKRRNWSFIAICSSVICGSVTKESTASTIVTYLDTNSSIAGKRLTIAVGISQSTIANTVRNVGKTADCLGQKGTDKRCKYIY